MSVLIKGMEMPRDCGECRFGYDGKCFAVSPIHRFFVGDTFECPLIEIPPHGRLIDADRLGRWMCRHKNGKAKTCDRCEAYWNGNNINTNCSEVKLWALRLINDMPTIIEAEE